MTTRELRELLLKLDPAESMEVICTRCSDYGEVAPEDVSVIRAVKKPSARYTMRYHTTMSDAEKAAAREFIHFAGN